MPLSKTIRDICVPLDEYPNVRDHAIFREAFAVLYKGFAAGKRFRHVLVLNDKDQLVGLLGIRDILRGMFPDYLRTQEASERSQAPVPDFPSLTLIWAETCQTQCREAATKPIRGFTAPVPVSVALDDPITKAAYLMVIHDASMLPVVDGDRVAGVVRMIDVFNEAAKAVLYG